LTVDRALVLGDGGLTSELAYTALSRGRIANHLYLAREPDDVRANHDADQRAIAQRDRILERGVSRSRGHGAMSDSWLTELMTAGQIAELLQIKRSTVMARPTTPRRADAPARACLLDGGRPMDPDFD
jgi:hypothetical protein